MSIYFKKVGKSAQSYKSWNFLEHTIKMLKQVLWAEKIYTKWYQISDKRNKMILKNFFILIESTVPFIFAINYLPNPIQESPTTAHLLELSDRLSPLLLFSLLRVELGSPPPRKIYSLFTLMTSYCDLKIIFRIGNQVTMRCLERIHIQSDYYLFKHGTFRQRVMHRGKKAKWGEEIRVMCLYVMDIEDCQQTTRTEKRQGWSFPWSLKGPMALLIPCLWTSKLQNCQALISVLVAAQLVQQP